MDRPDYTNPISFALQEVPNWGRREWAGKEAEMKSFSFVSTVPTLPGGADLWDAYAIPAGKRFYLTDVGGGIEFAGVALYVIEDGADLWAAAIKPWDSKQSTFSVPISILAGEVLQFGVGNDDIVPGLIHGFFIGWEVEASKPKKPDPNNPLERYKLGDFNFANLVFLPGNETLITFNKHGEKKRGYVRVKNLYRKGEKLLGAGFPKKETVGKILEKIRREREVTTDFIEKLEKKHKIIKGKGSK